MNETETERTTVSATSGWAFNCENGQSCIFWNLHCNVWLYFREFRTDLQSYSQEELPTQSDTR